MEAYGPGQVSSAGKVYCSDEGRAIELLIEDGRIRVENALQALRDRKEELGLKDLQLRSIEEFEDDIARLGLSLEGRETIVEQAIVLIEQLYVHLPFKRTRYAINPAQRLRLLRHRSPGMSDSQFHAEMLETFNELRDAHTFYSLPMPYRGSTAFLPFLMTSFIEEGVPKYVVTHVLDGFGECAFGRGAEVTLWNGMPVSLAVRRMADRTPAGNDAAREARGMAQMTMRSLAYALPPDERVVYLHYKPYGAEEEQAIALPWSIGTGLSEIRLVQSIEATSIYGPLAESDCARQLLWYRDKRKKVLKIEKEYQGLVPGTYDSKARLAVLSAPEAAPVSDSISLADVSRFPRVFEFQHSGGEPGAGVPPQWLTDPRRKNRRIGYIRIRSFDLPEDDFVEEFKRILDLMREVAPEGLILDIRGNPGGSIKAADRILQFLTPKEVRPALFHFSITSLIQEIVLEIEKLGESATQGTTADLRPWIQDILESVVSGDVMTGGRPLTPVELANDTGQRYLGPVTLIVDARVYSAAEIFAAGFQDHEIGDVIGVSERTGGGGANRWLHEDLISRLSEIKGLPLAPLPSGAMLTKLPGDAHLALAFRRSSRVRKNAGYAIEDVGVKADHVHKPTRADFEKGDRDLLRFVLSKLGKRPVYSLDIKKAVIRNNVADVEVTSRNLDRLECFVDLYPQCAAAVSPEGDHRTKIRVPLHGLPGRGRRQLKIQGYARGGPDGRRMLVAAAITRMETAR